MTEDELHKKIYEKGLLEEWSKITIERWRDKMAKYKVGKTGDLARSFKYSIRPDRIKLSFKYYGRFVDMGVGKGTKIGDVKEGRSINARVLNQLNARKRKPWYSKTLASEVYQLQRILASRYGKGTAEFIAANLKVPIVIEG